MIVQVVITVLTQPKKYNVLPDTFVLLAQLQEQIINVLQDTFVLLDQAIMLIIHVLQVHTVQQEQLIRQLFYALQEHTALLEQLIQQLNNVLQERIVLQQEVKKYLTVQDVLLEHIRREPDKQQIHVLHVLPVNIQAQVLLCVPYVLPVHILWRVLEHVLIALLETIAQQTLPVDYMILKPRALQERIALLQR